MNLKEKKLYFKINIKYKEISFNNFENKIIPQYQEAGSFI